jgi:predicted nucleic acid-binding protein
LETTLFNYYFDEDREAHGDTVKLFEAIAEGKYQAFTSAYAVNELNNASHKKCDKMIALIEQYGIQVLDFNDNAEQLADAYIKHGIVAPAYRTDGIHIAVAAVNDLDMIISMNLRPIVKPRTREGARIINALRSYRTVEICTPMEVNENEKEEHD